MMIRSKVRFVGTRAVCALAFLLAKSDRRCRGRVVDEWSYYG
jgi:hypothetical protein